MFKSPNRKMMRGMINLLKGFKKKRQIDPQDLVKQIMKPMGIQLKGKTPDELLSSLEEQCNKSGESQKFAQAQALVTNFLKERGDSKVTSLSDTTDLVADLMDACGQSRMADMVSMASTFLDDDSGDQDQNDSEEANDG